MQGCERRCVYWEYVMRTMYHFFSMRPPIPQAQPRPVQLNLDPVSIPACTATRVDVYLYFTFTMHLVAECGGHPSFSASRQQAYFLAWSLKTLQLGFCYHPMSCPACKNPCTTRHAPYFDQWFILVRGALHQTGLATYKTLKCYRLMPLCATQVDATMCHRETDFGTLQCKETDSSAHEPLQHVVIEGTISTSYGLRGRSSKLLISMSNVQPCPGP